MSDYTPDRWVMLKISHEGVPTYKILAGWYGGYSNGDSWKLNSGVTQIKETDTEYLFYGYSGSVYHCHKQSYGLSTYTASILNGFQEQVKDATDIIIEMLPEESKFMEINYAPN